MGGNGRLTDESFSTKRTIEPSGHDSSINRLIETHTNSRGPLSDARVRGVPSLVCPCPHASGRPRLSYLSLSCVSPMVPPWLFGGGELLDQIYWNPQFRKPSPFGDFPSYFDLEPLFSNSNAAYPCAKHAHYFFHFSEL